jgi:hypothetical protein
MLRLTSCTGNYLRQSIALFIGPHDRIRDRPGRLPTHLCAPFCFYALSEHIIWARLLSGMDRELRPVDVYQISCLRIPLSCGCTHSRHQCNLSHKMSPITSHGRYVNIRISQHKTSPFVHVPGADHDTRSGLRASAGLSSHHLSCEMIIEGFYVGYGTLIYFPFCTVRRSKDV